jgi:hypothetical protein
MHGYLHASFRFDVPEGHDHRELHNLGRGRESGELHVYDYRAGHSGSYYHLPCEPDQKH